MNCLKRPARDPDWDAHPKVVAAREGLRAIVDAGGKPRSSNKERPQGDFPDLWKILRIADVFARSQQRICGYCAARIYTDDPHLDHYRPKAELTREILSPGAEAPELGKMSGRRLGPEPAIQPAYWWLAYDWDNFIATCSICNSKWKRTLLPVRTGSHGVPEEGDEKTEEPLLLNAFDLEDPLEHFAFDDLGAIAGKTDEGMSTIDVCGLDRPSLDRARREHLATWPLLLDDLARPDLPQGKRAQTLALLVKQGSWDKPFAAALRSLAANRGLVWAALEAECSTDASTVPGSPGMSR